jgi:hypothetical protein
MRTAIVVVIGIALAAGFDVGAAAWNRRAGRNADGMLGFLWTWLAFTLADFGIGVAAGHGAIMELAIHALVFAVPAAAAFVLSRRRRPSSGKS